ncbi:MAG: GNAT family N-acetyltransferase [Bacteroidia bacterium]|nr:MAG: GNAT family N-acetyltransferase [Bacteroidia bacterium]
MQKEIIPPVDRSLIKDELNSTTFLRKTNNAGNEIYIVTANNAPNTVREIGRLRELSFRSAGGGTGKDMDLDHYDFAEVPYNQLIVWDPVAAEIVGGYRYMCCWEVPKQEDGTPLVATAALFHFSPKFLDEFLPYTIELGRSFVQPDYQPSRDNRKSIYSLDNLWDGLGGLVVDHARLKYFVGKVTMFKDFDPYARDLILYFMQRFFPDKENLIRPHQPLAIHTPFEQLEKEFVPGSFEENYRILSQKVRERKENIPPLFNSYMGLSPTMKTFGTALNEGFGGVEETGIMVTVQDIYDSKSKRHVSTYKKVPK